MYFRNAAALNAAATHDFIGINGVFNGLPAWFSNIAWRQSGGATAVWAMRGATVDQTFGYGTVRQLADRRPARLQQRRLPRPALARAPAARRRSG